MDSVLDRSLGPGFDAFEALLDRPEDREQNEREIRVMMMTRELLMAIDAERARRGLSKSDLADLAGIHPQQVRRLFTSERANPTMKTLLTILAALRIGWTFTLPETASAVANAPATDDGDSTIVGETAPEAESREHQTSVHGRSRDAA